MEKITKIYVAAMSIEGFDGETIFTGTKTEDDGNTYSRSTVEHHDWAINSLIELAEAVVEAYKLQGMEASYRLLMFENPTELDPEIYAGAMNRYVHFTPFGGKEKE